MTIILGGDSLIHKTKKLDMNPRFQGGSPRLRALREGATHSMVKMKINRLNIEGGIYELIVKM
jgi:hypothetical protein